jgi:hypothetical protein
MKHRVFVVVLLLIVVAGGSVISKDISDAAAGTAVCAKGNPRPVLSTGWSFAGLPKSMGLNFAYGRGTRAASDSFTAANPISPAKPKSFQTFILPLTNSKGDQLGVRATATQRDGSNLYVLQICIAATRPVAAGTYTGQILFPGAAAARLGPVVTATFQSQAVPWVLWAIGPFMLILGLLYTAVVFVRRAKPEITMQELPDKVAKALWSTNGIVALIAGAGAGFGLWRVQVYANPTWGAHWPDIAIGIVSIAIAAAGAASLPMAFGQNTP